MLRVPSLLLSRYREDQTRSAMRATPEPALRRAEKSKKEGERVDMRAKGGARQGGWLAVVFMGATTGLSFCMKKPILRFEDGDPWLAPTTVSGRWRQGSNCVWPGVREVRAAQQPKQSDRCPLPPRPWRLESHAAGFLALGFCMMFAGSRIRQALHQSHSICCPGGPRESEQLWLRAYWADRWRSG